MPGPGTKKKKRKRPGPEDLLAEAKRKNEELLQRDRQMVAECQEMHSRLQAVEKERDEWRAKYEQQESARHEPTAAADTGATAPAATTAAPAVEHNGTTLLATVVTAPATTAAAPVPDTRTAAAPAVESSGARSGATVALPATGATAPAVTTAGAAPAVEPFFNISSFSQFQKHEKLKDERIGRRYW